MSLSRRLQRLLLTAWVGSLWAVGYLAVPVLFASLDRATAGALAGEMFTLVSYVGMVCGALLLLLRAVRVWPALGDWRTWLLAAMLVLVVVGELLLQPMMAELKARGLEADGGRLAAFGRLHGIASLLYLLESVGGVVLVVAGMEGRRQVSSGA